MEYIADGLLRGFNTILFALFITLMIKSMDVYERTDHTVKKAIEQNSSIADIGENLYSDDSLRGEAVFNDILNCPDDMIIYLNGTNLTEEEYPDHTNFLRYARAGNTEDLINKITVDALYTRKCEINNEGIVKCVKYIRQ